MHHLLFQVNHRYAIFCGESSLADPKCADLQLKMEQCPTPLGKLLKLMREYIILSGEKHVNMCWAECHKQGEKV